MPDDIAGGYDERLRRFVEGIQDPVPRELAQRLMENRWGMAPMPLDLVEVIVQLDYVRRGIERSLRVAYPRLDRQERLRRAFQIVEEATKAVMDLDDGSASADVPG